MRAEALEARQLLAADLQGDQLSTALAVTLQANQIVQQVATIGDGDHGNKDVDLFRVNLSADLKGRLVRGEIDHPPWDLSSAKWNPQCNTMGDPYNFRFDGEPHPLFAQPIAVRAWLATRCDR